MNSPKSVLITGANRGIGLGMVKEFLKDPKVEHVFATMREVEKSEELHSIKDARLHVVKMDVTSDESIHEAYKEVAHILKEDGLNVLINNSGIYTEYPYLNEEKPDRKAVNQIFDVNSTAPLIVTQVFLPLLRKAADPSEFCVHRSAILNVSSGLGSMGNNYIGSEYRNCLIYRMSKTALNMTMKTLSIDLAPEGILVMSFCPGGVTTDMGGPNATNTVERAVACIMSLIQKLSREDCGAFYNALNGEKYPY